MPVTRTNIVQHFYPLSKKKKHYETFSALGHIGLGGLDPFFLK